MNVVNIFDVVELYDGNKAIIVSKNKDSYNIKKINNNGESIKIDNINVKDINKIIYKHK